MTNAPRIWRDFGSALPFQTCLTQTKLVLPLSNEHGSQVKDQGRQQCCHNENKNFPIGLHVIYLYFPDTPRIISTVCMYVCMCIYVCICIYVCVPFLTIINVFNHSLTVSFKILCSVVPLIPT